MVAPVVLVLEAAVRDETAELWDQVLEDGKGLEG